MNNLKVASLFSGVGTPEQSLKHLGIEHETVFACEIDKYARETYLVNNQEPITFYEDVYTIDGKKYKNQIDVLVGGSPCQSFSIAGKRKGTDCPRGNLIYEYFRIVEEAQPKVFIYENVKGFLSIDKKDKKDKYGETFTNFVQSFKDLGYTTYHQVLNTKDYGIPQNRERIYIVGFKNDVDFSFQEKQELKLRLKDMLEDSVDEKYHLDQKRISSCLKSNHSQQRVYCPSGIAPTLSAGSNGGGKEPVKMLYHSHNLDIKGNDSIKRIYSEEGLSPALTTMGGRHREPKVAIANNLIEVENDEVKVKEAVKKGYTVANEGDSINISVPSSKTRRGRVGKGVAQTLDTACNQVVFNDKFIFRKLTPRECFRLQGFDDNFKFPEKMSNTQLYKQAGNGMSRNILDMIFTQVLTSYTKHIENENI